MRGKGGGKQAWGGRAEKEGGRVGGGDRTSSCVGAAPRVCSVTVWPATAATRLMTLSRGLTGRMLITTSPACVCVCVCVCAHKVRVILRVCVCVCMCTSV